MQLKNTAKLIRTDNLQTGGNRKEINWCNKIERYLSSVYIIWYPLIFLCSDYIDKHLRSFYILMSIYFFKYFFSVLIIKHLVTDSWLLTYKKWMGKRLLRKGAKQEWRAVLVTGLFILLFSTWVSQRIYFSLSSHHDDSKIITLIERRSLGLV